MKSQIYWTENAFPGKIAIIARPRGGDWLEDEIASLKQAGIDVVVSLLEKHEELETDLESERKVAEAKGLQFFSFPIVDRSVPKSKTDAVEFLLRLQSLLKSGKNVGIHCRQSVGRAGLIAAGLFALFDIEPTKALQELTAARGVQIPETEVQKKWIENFAAEISPSF